MPAKTTEKACSDCGVTKPLEEFFRDSKRPDGRYAWCKACNTIRTKTAKARREGAFVPPLAKPAGKVVKTKPVDIEAIKRKAIREAGKRSKPIATKPAPVETIDERVTRAQVARKVSGGVDTSMAEVAAKIAEDAKADIAARKAAKAAQPDMHPAKHVWTPRNDEQRAADAARARARRAAKKAAQS
jgi:hypothetical protein